MTTAVSIINSAMGLLAASTITRIDPPGNSRETYFATNYPLWRDTELAKRRWVFATVIEQLTLEGDPLTGEDKPYRYALNTACLRPIRRHGEDWVQRGRYLYSAYDTLKIESVQRVPEADFDPLFTAALAAYIAMQACEYVTQSNTKIEKAMKAYDDAINDARSTNAFTIGQEPNAQDGDAGFTWVEERY